MCWNAKGEAAGRTSVSPGHSWEAACSSPGGSLGGMGVGAWFLHRFGMPPKQIAERQFNLSFLNTTVSAFGLIVSGLGLATGLFPGEDNLLLTLLPAAVAAIAIAAALLLARRASAYAGRLKPRHPKIATSITTLADAVADTRALFHRGGWRSVLGAVAYFGFEVVVLWSAFLAIHAHPVPGFAVVMMAYVIGALGGSLPLRPASGRSAASQACSLSTGSTTTRPSPPFCTTRRSDCSYR